MLDKEIKRLSILVIFDPQDFISESDIFLMQEVANVSKRLIVCINANGYIDISRIKKITSEVIVRENKGFDAGAIKYVICKYLKGDDLKMYDELFICNNSFFGPFIPLSVIFDRMKNSQCDYWGLQKENKKYNFLYSGIGSYFWVFRARIIQSGVIESYFKEYINEETDSFFEVCALYECGLNSYLSKQYKSDAYMDLEHLIIFEAGDYTLLKYNFPILKRKFFVEQRTTQERIQNVYNYLKSIDKYEMVKEKIERLYGIEIEASGKDYVIPNINNEEYILPKMSVGEEEIEKFLLNPNIYIYGTGHIAELVWGVFCRIKGKRIDGFIDSNSTGKLFFHGYTVIAPDEIPPNSSILVAMNKNNAKQVEEVVSKFNYLKLY